MLNCNIASAIARMRPTSLDRHCFLILRLSSVDCGFFIAVSYESSLLGLFDREHGRPKPDVSN